MASGDITTVKEYGRYAIPGAGHNLQGQAKNNKVLVWGQLIGTYVTTGMDLEAIGGLKALGVSTCDFFCFNVRYSGAAGTTVCTDMAVPVVDYEQASGNPGKIFVADEAGAANIAEPTDADIITIDFLVIGEDATAPELV